MHHLLNWWGRVRLQLRLQILIQGFLVVILLAAQQWILIQIEQEGLRSAEERTQAVADGVINGLNTLMVANVGDHEVIRDKASRALFIEKMGKSEKLKELRIVRAKQLGIEFSEALPQEQPVDDIDRAVLADGKAQFNINRNETSLRAVLPFIAMKEFRSSKCLKCHGVEEGAVLGVASVTIDIKDRKGSRLESQCRLPFVERLLSLCLNVGSGSEAAGQYFDKQTFKPASLIFCSENCEWPVLGVERTLVRRVSG